MSYALTAAPTGATLSGDTVTWTPTWKQSRIPNQFTVTATTTAGGSSSQSWTVTPNGSVHGSYINTYWTDQGPVALPVDTTRSSFEAFLPQPDGSLQVWPAVGTTQGTFTIPDVPAGYYWLKLGTSMYWTNSSTFDYGSDYVGSEPSSTSGEGSFTFDLTGLDPWAGGDFLTFYSPNEGTVATLAQQEEVCVPPVLCNPQPANGATTFAETEMIPFVSSLGDTSYILQSEEVPSSFPLLGTVMGPGLSLSSSALLPGMTITGALSPSAISSMDINIKGSVWGQWGQMMAQLPTVPNQIPEVIASLSVQPFVADRAAREPLLNLPRLMSVYDFQLTVDQDFGTVQYENPFPSTWLPVFTASEMSCVPITTGSPSVGVCAEMGYSTTSLPSPTTAITPPLSPVQDPKLDGTNLFTAVTTNSPTPTLSWNPPIGLAPIGYEVSIIQIIPSSDSPFNLPNILVVAHIYTGQTSLTVPPGILSPGSTYLFAIQALFDARANLANSPNRSAYPTAYAQAISTPITIGGGSSTSAVSGVSAMAVYPESQASGTSKSSSQRQFYFVDSEGHLHSVSK
jgi:hypothetical protein